MDGIEEHIDLREDDSVVPCDSIVPLSHDKWKDT